MTIRSVLLAALALLPFLAADALNASPSCDFAASPSRPALVVIWLPTDIGIPQGSQAGDPAVGSAVGPLSLSDRAGAAAEPFDGVITADLLETGIKGLGRQTIF